MTQEKTEVAFKISRNQEITCNLWRMGEIEPSENGAPPRALCKFYFADGKCSHKQGPLLCSTGGLRSALV